MDNPRISLARTSAFCARGRSTLLHCANIVEHDWRSLKPGLTMLQDPNHAYMQCIDPGEPCACGGVVSECPGIERGSDK